AASRNRTDPLLVMAESVEPGRSAGRGAVADFVCALLSGAGRRVCRDSAAANGVVDLCSRSHARRVERRVPFSAARVLQAALEDAAPGVADSAGADGLAGGSAFIARSILAGSDFARGRRRLFRAGAF